MTVYFIIIVIVIFIDQWSKGRAFLYLEENNFPVKKGFITLQIARNEGATLGFLRNRKKLLMSLIIIMMIILSYIFIISFTDGYPELTKLGVSMVLGGALGNLRDRLRFKYVRDFFSFNFKKSPIFNLADMFIFLGAIIAVFVL